MVGIGVELDQLVGAFTHLPLLVEHKAASESIDFAMVRHCSVTLSTLDDFIACEGDPLPDDLVSFDLGEHNLLADIVVEPTHQVHIVTYSRQCCAFTWRWLSLRVDWNLHVDAETFSLLHALDVGLEASDKLVDELVLGDIVGRVDHELLIFLLVTRLCLLVHMARAGPSVLDPLRDQFGLSVLKIEL